MMQLWPLLLPRFCPTIFKVVERWSTTKCNKKSVFVKQTYLSLSFVTLEKSLFRQLGWLVILQQDRLLPLLTMQLVLLLRLQKSLELSSRNFKSYFVLQIHTFSSAKSASATCLS